MWKFLVHKGLTTYLKLTLQFVAPGSPLLLKAHYEHFHRFKKTAFTVLRVLISNPGLLQLNEIVEKCPKLSSQSIETALKFLKENNLATSEDNKWSVAEP